MAQRRSSMEISFSILSSLKDGPKLTTRIVQEANVNSKTLHDYLEPLAGEELVAREMVEIAYTLRGEVEVRSGPDSDRQEWWRGRYPRRRGMYRLTEKGWRALMLLTEARNLLGLDDISAETQR